MGLRSRTIKYKTRVGEHTSLIRRVTRGGRGGGGLPSPFSKFKEKCPDFGKIP